ncbi:MAG: hypothetical protein AVDCRST_MAG73-2853, partial [uncultured Thermomicrobiales bacterium]
APSPSVGHPPGPGLGQPGDAARRRRVDVLRPVLRRDASFGERPRGNDDHHDRREQLAGPDGGNPGRVRGPGRRVGSDRHRRRDRPRDGRHLRHQRHHLRLLVDGADLPQRGRGAGGGDPQHYRGSPRPLRHGVGDGRDRRRDPDRGCAGRRTGGRDDGPDRGLRHGRNLPLPEQRQRPESPAAGPGGTDLDHGDGRRPRWRCGQGGGGGARGPAGGRLRSLDQSRRDRGSDPCPGGGRRRRHPGRAAGETGRSHGPACRRQPRLGQLRRRLGPRRGPGGNRRGADRPRRRRGGDRRDHGAADPGTDRHSPANRDGDAIAHRHADAGADANANARPLHRHGPGRRRRWQLDRRRPCRSDGGAGDLLHRPGRRRLPRRRAVHGRADRTRRRRRRHGRRRRRAGAGGRGRATGGDRPSLPAARSLATAAGRVPRLSRGGRRGRPSPGPRARLLGAVGRPATARCVPPRRNAPGSRAPPAAAPDPRSGRSAGTGSLV